MKFRNAFVSLAAAGLVIAPVAAQAGTSAAASVPSVAGRVSTDVSKDQKIAPGLLVAILVAAGAATYGLVEAFDSGNKSNGAN